MFTHFILSLEREFIDPELKNRVGEKRYRPNWEMVHHFTDFHGITSDLHKPTRPIDRQGLIPAHIDVPLLSLKCWDIIDDVDENIMDRVLKVNFLVGYYNPIMRDNCRKWAHVMLKSPVFGLVGPIRQHIVYDQKDTNEVIDFSMDTLNRLYVSNPTLRTKIFKVFFCTHQTKNTNTNTTLNEQDSSTALSSIDIDIDNGKEIEEGTHRQLSMFDPLRVLVELYLHSKQQRTEIGMYKCLTLIKFLMVMMHNDRNTVNYHGIGMPVGIDFDLFLEMNKNLTLLGLPFSHSRYLIHIYYIYYLSYLTLYITFIIFIYFYLFILFIYLFILFIYFYLLFIYLFIYLFIIYLFIFSHLALSILSCW